MSIETLTVFIHCFMRNGHSFKTIGDPLDPRFSTKRLCPICTVSMQLTLKIHITNSELSQGCGAVLVLANLKKISNYVSFKL